MSSASGDDTIARKDGSGLEFLGVGGSAIVYGINAHQVLKQYFDYGKEQECKALDRLGVHPNIIQRLSSTFNSRKEIVLQRGECLRNILQRDTLPPLADRINYARQAATGLDYIHRKGILHADVGPHNLVLIDQHALAFIDFEGCLIDGESYHESALYEWCSYRPSRNSEGDFQVNTATEIFAYGCTLYELMTGKQPHHDLTENPATDERGGYAQTRWENSQFPDVDNLPLSNVILGCWNSQYHSMQEVLKALDTA